MAPAPRLPADLAPPERGTSAAATRLFETDYDLAATPTSLAGIWRSKQLPADPSGVVQADRIRVEDAPGDPTDPSRPSGRVMRVELRPYDDPSRPGPADGDVTNTGGYLANRAEVYDRIATRGTAATAWPDPVNAVRWYAWSTYVPPDFPTDPAKWFAFTQWKGLDTGAPPMEMRLVGDQIQLGGRNVCRGLGPLARGRWMRFVVGVRFSPDPAWGWVRVEIDGHLALARTPVATMNTKWSGGAVVVDPNYLKQGIYRSAAWTTTQVMYFGPTVIGTTRAAVL
jgi:hypothetical protein